MNFETRQISVETSSGGSGDGWDSAAIEPANKRRRWIIIGVVAGVIAAIILYFALSGGGEDAAKAGANKGETTPPAVTVMTPGRRSVERVISATGTLSARREMPIGVAGEGGQVVRVLVEPGQWVGAGQVLATVDRSVQTQQASQLAAQIRVAEADARLAQSEVERAEALIGRGFISRADLDRRIATRDGADARVRVAQASLAEAQARTGRLDIRAPAAGLVLTRGVEPGQIVGAGSGILFRIARGGEMELLARVGESDLVALSVGARATVTPVGADRGFTGQIWQLSPVIDPQTRQGTARIALAYATGLRPGGFAEARIVSGSTQAPLLPESSVLSGDEGNYVYIIDSANKAQRRAVTTGTVTDEGVPILSGLTGQERVVVSAGAFINPGDVVRPVVAPRR